VDGPASIWIYSQRFCLTPPSGKWRRAVNAPIDLGGSLWTFGLAEKAMRVIAAPLRTN